MLEKALDGVKKQQAAAEHDLNELHRLGQQRKNIEGELSRVRQQLAESSMVSKPYIQTFILGILVCDRPCTIGKVVLFMYETHPLRSQPHKFVT